MPTQEDIMQAIESEFNGGSQPDMEQEIIGLLRGAGAGKQIEKMHPEISYKDRIIVKNFANTADDSVNYLKSKYPEMEIKSKDGRVLIRSPKDIDWNVLDPDKLELADLGDIIYDGIAAIGESAATVGGAAAGGLPGAMAAGGLSSSALEGLRQSIGQQFIPEQEADLASVGISGALGGLLPGAGKVAGKLYKGVSRGVPTKLTGIKRELFDKLIESPKDVLEKSRVNTAREAIDKIATGHEVLGRVNEEMMEVARATKGIDISSVRKLFSNEIEKLERGALKFSSKGRIDAVDDMRKVYETLFPVDATDIIDGDLAITLRRDIGDVRQFKDNDIFNLGIKNKKNVKGIAGQAYSELNKRIGDVNPDIIKLGHKYADFKNLEKNISKVVGKEQDVLNFVRTADKETKEAVKESLERYAKEVNINQDVKEAFKTLEAQALFQKGTRPTSKAPLTAAGGVLGGILGRMTLGGAAGGALGGYEGLVAGAAIGGGMGNLLSNPKFLAKYGRLLSAMERNAAKADEMLPLINKLNTAVKKKAAPLGKSKLSIPNITAIGYGVGVPTGRSVWELQKEKR